MSKEQENQEETKIILQEIKDHASYWHSDIAKRFTVEKHLSAKGVNNVHAKIDDLVSSGILTIILRHAGDYIKIQSTEDPEARARARKILGARE